MDVDGSGTIDFGEFLSVLHTAHQPPNSSLSSPSSTTFSPKGGTGALLASVAESEAYHEYTDSVSEFDRQLQKSSASATKSVWGPRTPAGNPPSSYSPSLSPTSWLSPSPPSLPQGKGTLEFTPASAGGAQALEGQHNNRSTNSVGFTPTPTPTQKPLARKVSFSVGGYSDDSNAASSNGKNRHSNMNAARPSALAVPSPPGTRSTPVWSPHTPADDADGSTIHSPLTASSTHSSSKGSSPPSSPRSALRAQSRIGTQVPNNNNNDSGSGCGSSSNGAKSWGRRGSALAPPAASSGGRAPSSLEQFLSSAPGTYERHLTSLSSATPPGGAKRQGSLSSLRNRRPSTMTSLDPFTRAGVAPPSYAATSPPPIATSPVSTTTAAAAAASPGVIISAEAPFAGLPPVSEQQVEAMPVPLHLKRRVTPEQVSA